MTRPHRDPDRLKQEQATTKRLMFVAGLLALVLVATLVWQNVNAFWEKLWL